MTNTTVKRTNLEAIPHGDRLMIRSPRFPIEIDLNACSRAHKGIQVIGFFCIWNGEICEDFIPGTQSSTRNQKHLVLPLATYQSNKAWRVSNRRTETYQNATLCSWHLCKARSRPCFQSIEGRSSICPRILVVDLKSLARRRHTYIHKCPCSTIFATDSLSSCTTIRQSCSICITLKEKFIPCAIARK